MYLMLQQDRAGDYVIATGESFFLADFVSAAFAAVDLDWRDHVEIDDSLLRPTDLAVGRGNPHKAREILGWEAKYNMNDVVTMMIAAKVKISV
jgi:GDPmannose 4,6-dehydratase